MTWYPRIWDAIYWQPATSKRYLLARAAVVADVVAAAALVLVTALTRPPVAGVAPLTRARRVTVSIRWTRAVLATVAQHLVVALVDWKPQYQMSLMI